VTVILFFLITVSLQHPVLSGPTKRGYQHSVKGWISSRTGVSVLQISCRCNSCRYYSWPRTCLWRVLVWAVLLYVPWTGRLFDTVAGILDEER